MLDIDWQEHLARGRRKTRIQRAIALIVILIFAIWGIWYFCFADSPEYALKQLNTAIKNRNTQQITKYCNIDSVTSKAYDDLTRDMFAHDSKLSDQTKVMFETFYIKIKPQVLKETTQLLLSYAAKGNWQEPVADNILKGRQLGIDYEYLIEKSQLRNTQFEKIESVTRNGDSAIAKIQVKDTYTDTLFTLQLQMKKNDGQWQVTEIQNYRYYLDFIAPIQNAGIAKYVANTADIIDKYNNILSTQEKRLGQLTATNDGQLTNKQKADIVKYIESDLIPAAEKRQQELDAIQVNEGAQYIAMLRNQSTAVTIESWQHLAIALNSNSPDEYIISQSYRKDAQDLDHRLEDILKNSAINAIPKTMP